MKTNHIAALMAFISCLPLCINSCDHENLTEEITELNLLSDKTVNIEAEGGKYSISYELINPVADTKLEIICEAEWISILEKNDTDIVFEASANTDVDTRTASIDVFYGDLSFSVILVQSGIKPDRR